MYIPIHPSLLIPYVRSLPHIATGYFLYPYQNQGVLPTQFLFKLILLTYLFYKCSTGFVPLSPCSGLFSSIPSEARPFLYFLEMCTSDFFQTGKPVYTLLKFLRNP